MAEDKNFAKGLAIKSREFADGGTILKVGIKVDEFVQWLMTLPATNGWANIQICKNRQPTAKGLTHYASEDTWKPTRAPAQENYPGEAGDRKRDERKDEKLEPAAFVAYEMPF